ncbi:MAG TPA: DUF2961 domain-containing protein [Abditibacteriaceae bacterium]
MLYAPKLPPYKWFASTDPQGKNEDYILLKPGETRRLPLSAGKLLRLWSTASQPEKVVLSLVNGATTPLMGGNQAMTSYLYEKAFTLYPMGGMPPEISDLKDNAALVVTNRDTQPNKWFYQVTVRARSVELPPVLDSQEHEQPEHTIAAGKEVTLFSADRAGLLTSLTINVPSASPDVLRNLRLRATWDEGAKSAVDVPLPALTGQFFAVNPVRSYVWVFSPGRNHALLTLMFPMPYGAGARITLLNNNTTAVQVSAKFGREKEPDKELPTDYRFCAQYGSARTQNGQPVQMLRVLGSGAFVGLNLGIAPAPGSTRRAFAYLEGNETITADGRKYEGTGAEDFFNSAWYFPEKPFSRLYHGMTFKSALPPQVSAYRLMIADAVPFQKSLNFAFGHGSSNRGDDLEYRWVAFWYQKAPLNFEVPDTLSSSTNAAVAGEGAAGTQPAPWQSTWRWLIWLAPVTLLVVFMSRALRRRKAAPH